MQGPGERVGARRQLLIKRPGMARCMPPKGSHRARGGAPIAIFLQCVFSFFFFLLPERYGGGYYRTTTPAPPSLRVPVVVCLLCRSSQSVGSTMVNDVQAGLSSRTYHVSVGRLVWF